MLLLLGGVLGGLGEEVVDYQRELRDKTKSFFVTSNVTFYGSDQGAHRDMLHHFFVAEETIAATGGQFTRQEHSNGINQQILTDLDLSASGFAVSELYRTPNACAAERRCRDESVVSAFQPYASIDCDMFYLALRRADCDGSFPIRKRRRRKSRISPLPRRTDARPSHLSSEGCVSNSPPIAPPLFRNRDFQCNVKHKRV